jgi:hypothetical protein
MGRKHDTARRRDDIDRKRGDIGEEKGRRQRRADVNITGSKMKKIYTIDLATINGL